ncbi:hypothetical protein [Xanthomonas translucens]|uniref:hypothetical protein n=1 Tax=Xanthomonas campestris pv. translucens TaxID=343 RepID=UPI00071E6FA2|nr:hypothetical protein [Xanthomonas translucens]UKE41857.1 hypothetical protein KCU58_19950 [Xanthomonas translucens pv. undulosa]UPU47165.1 hypothetical protein MZO50_00385 [Xanthomonas translucens pv. undulosa]UPU47200.1 hypothetical protein MZO50_00135 [Xanthomonas translucens pv. undulosa]
MHTTFVPPHGNAPAIARVSINGIDVGSLPADQYRRIVAESRRDWRLWVAQSLAWAAVILRLVSLVLQVMAVCWLLFIPLLALLAPADLTAMIATLAKTPPAEITKGIRTLLTFFIGLGVLAMFMAPIFTPSLVQPLVNHFDRAISRRIRELLEVPTEGDIRVMLTTITVTPAEPTSTQG